MLENTFYFWETVPTILFAYAMNAVLSVFILICLEAFQDLQYLLKAMKNFSKCSSKKLIGSARSSTISLLLGSIHKWLATYFISIYYKVNYLFINVLKNLKNLLKPPIQFLNFQSVECVRLWIEVLLIKF